MGYFNYLLLLWFFESSFAQENLFVNADFEDPFDGNWYCNGGCTLEHSGDAYSGDSSGFISGRTLDWNAACQDVEVEAGKKYVFRAYIKILNMLPGVYWHTAHSFFRIQYADEELDHRIVGIADYVRPDWGWQEVGGDFYFEDDREIDHVRIYVQIVNSIGEGTAVDYLMDAASMIEIPQNPNWREEANIRIEELRKGDLTINVEVDESCDPNYVTVQIDLIKHDFPFGTCVVADMINGDTEEDEKYRETFFENFEFSVFENAHKWVSMEWNRGNINLQRPDDALDVLESRGVESRGHTAFWGNMDRNPNWLIDGSYEGEELRDELQRRIDYLIPHYAGRLRHWDVNNEQLHNYWYEQAIGDIDVTDWIFEEIHRQDPDTELFLNEFAIVNSPGLRTMGYAHQAKRLLGKGLPVHGIGIQSHLGSYPDIDRMMVRLEAMASAGLPIWITELDYADEDKERRADGLEDAMRLYFSQPYIHGILLWGFWDGKMSKPDAALFEGADFEANAAGLRWQQLLREEWSTSDTFTPSSDTDTQTVRAFYGNYSVVVSYDGDDTEQRYFYFKADADDEIDIVVNCPEEKQK